MVRVSRVLPDSIAEQVGIAPGTELLSVNGRTLEDFLDWEFLTADDELLITARLADGTELELELEREPGEPLGVELEPPRVRRCANKCEFCFIEGLPQGLRRNLYVRDDDYRLSFAYGNFATLSNLKERDFARILEYRLSPLYVSVHATPWDVRKVLLNNPRVPNVLEQLQRLAAGGIEFHAQMVVVPDMNDGEVLERSLSDLWNFGDAVLSAAGYLDEAELPYGIRIHSAGVARVAVAAAGLVAESGIPVDGWLVEAAALLHDIDKPEIRR